jgi:pimeloyl-ACP methyl ester carboxylesterase
MRFVRKQLMAFLILVNLHAHLCTQNHTAEELKNITIFVHGVVGLRHYASIKTFLRLMRDGRYPPYEKSIWRIREDPFFYQNQPMQALGLHPINMYDRKIGAAASLFAFIFDNLSPRPGTTHYYTFGWSGLAGSTACQEAAIVFYDQLREELEKPEYKNTCPTITIVGYSRGGNITLNMATVREQKYPEDTFRIENTVLIGTPVLRESRFLMRNSLFNKVYHFYSRKDWVQNHDFFSHSQFVSTRRFKRIEDGPLRNKLVQAEVRVSQVTPSGCHYLDRSPSHNELWFFSWPPLTSTPCSPIAPFPFAAFIPLIINGFTHSAPEIKDAIVELRPQKERIIIRKRHCQRPRYYAPFVTTELIENLKEQAYSQQPPHYTKRLTNAHARSAIKQVQPCRIPLKRHRRQSLCGA